MGEGLKHAQRLLDLQRIHGEDPEQIDVVSPWMQAERCTSGLKAKEMGRHQRPQHPFPFPVGQHADHGVKGEVSGTIILDVDGQLTVEDQPADAVGQRETGEIEAAAQFLDEIGGIHS